MTTQCRAQYTLLDPLRCLASFGVVWHHTREGWFGGIAFGLFLFFLIMFGLSGSSTRSESTLGFAKRRASGLLVPWLRWSCLFFLWQLSVDVLLEARAPLERYRHGHLFAGASFHLWFLPFAWGALIVGRATLGAFARWPRGWRVAFFTLFAFLGASWAATMNARYWMPPPYLCWTGALPAIPLGVAFGLALQAPTERGRRRLLGIIVGLAVVSAVASPRWGMGHDEVRRYLVATVLAATGFAFRPPVPMVVGRIATASFGVYLVHPFVILALETLPVLETWPASLHVSLVWSVSALVILALSKLPVALAETARLRALSSRVSLVSTMGESEASHP